jgi:tRNA-dihydrouridine synthase 3
MTGAGGSAPAAEEARFAGSPFAGKVWLAPLTLGGNLPFRRLCVELGAEVTVSEMVVVKKLLKGKSSEFALLRRHASEPFFGVQLADRAPDSLVEGARLAEARGASFVDLNCGCPINEMTRRGLGSSLLQKPGRLARLVSAMVSALSVPVTVKLRLGWHEGKENVVELARACEEAGASAIAIHGRTREQRYSRAADWDAIGRVAAERGVPVVGNGDILTHYEARVRWRRSGVSSVMLARGALIKPWLFREVREGREWLPTAEERLSLLWRFVELLREHFGTDERGRERTLRFLPWHLGFFCRYRPLPEADYAAEAEAHPLLQTRQPDQDVVAPLEALLRDPRPEVHEAFARELLLAGSREEAGERALRLQAGLPAMESGGTPTREPSAEVAG